LPKLPDEGEGRLYTWCRFLDAEDEDELRGLADKDPVIEKAVGMLLKLSEDEVLRYREDMRQKARWSKMAREDFVHDQGKAEGLAEGKAEGLAEGKAEGLAEGEVKAQVTIAHNLKEAGLPFDIIAQSTGLSLDEVAGL
jgi:predicted transposase/invertase (TIGR01784 family)